MYTMTFYDIDFQAGYRTHGRGSDTASTKRGRLMTDMAPPAFSTRRLRPESPPPSIISCVGGVPLFVTVTEQLKLFMDTDT